MLLLITIFLGILCAVFIGAIIIVLVLTEASLEEASTVLNNEYETKNDKQRNHTQNS